MVADSEVRQEVFGNGLAATFRWSLKRDGIRPTAKLIAVAAWTTSLFPILWIGLALLRGRARIRWRNAIVRPWASGVARLIGMKIEPRGQPPAAPFFLVANHLGYLDIILLLATLEGVFVAKRELNRWPVIGSLIRLTGMIFVDRDRARDAHRAMDDIAARIAGGDGVIVFPEGTSSGGHGVLPLKPALFEWAAQTQWPVSVATIYYESGRPDLPASDVICWWGKMSFLPHVLELCGLRGFTAFIRFDENPLIGSDRTTLAIRARAAISGGFPTEGIAREMEMPR